MAVGGSGKHERLPFELDQAWEGLGALIVSIGQDDFDRRLFNWVAGLVPVRILFAIELFDDARTGRVVITEGTDEDLTRRARAISKDYAASDFEQDDVLQGHRRRSPGVLELVVQEGARRHDHFRIKYYDAMGTPHEVSAFRSEGAATLYLGVSSGPQGFGTLDIARLRTVLPVTIGLVVHHSRLRRPTRLEGGEADREARFGRLLRGHCPALTAREAQVCAAIATGFRAEAIALRMGISVGTVASHRKHAYAKLRISSQTELFGILFTGWADA